MKEILILGMSILLSTTAFGQIPNPGFESWTNMGAYANPDGWDNADSLGSFASTYTCEQGSPGFSGNHYLKLTSKNTIAGVIAGIAMSGKIDFTTFLPKSGYAFSGGRPVSLNGVWQYAPASSTDTGSVTLLFTKWTGTSRDSVGFIYYKLPGSVTSWTPFSLPITYLNSETPDTAVIYFASSTATTADAGSYLYIDTLSFSNTGVGITGVQNSHSVISVYPNPGKAVFCINISSGIDEYVSVTITNMLGETVKKMTMTTNKNGTLHIDSPAGLYFINAITDHGQWSEKLVITR